MTPQIDHLGKDEPCSEGFNTHSEKMSPVLRVSTHIYDVYGGFLRR